MITDQRYTIILDHSTKVLLENASLPEVEAFLGKYDDRFSGVRMEDACGPYPRIIVTDKH